MTTLYESPNETYDQTKTYWTGREWIAPGGSEVGGPMQKGPVGEYGNLKNPYENHLVTLPANDPNSTYFFSSGPSAPPVTQTAQTGGPDPYQGPSAPPITKPIQPTQSAQPQFDQNQFTQFLGALMGIGRGGMGGYGGYGMGYPGFGGYGGGYGGYGMGYPGYGGYGGYGGGSPYFGGYGRSIPQPRLGIGRLSAPSSPPVPNPPAMMAGSGTYGVPPPYNQTPSGGMIRGGFPFRRGGRV